MAKLSFCLAMCFGVTSNCSIFYIVFASINSKRQFFYRNFFTWEKTWTLSHANDDRVFPDSYRLNLMVFLTRFPQTCRCPRTRATTRAWMWTSARSWTRCAARASVATPPAGSPAAAGRDTALINSPKCVSVSTTSWVLHRRRAVPEAAVCDEDDFVCSHPMPRLD